MLEAFRELMFEVVGSYFESEFPVTPLLSGGLDSSSIAAVAARILEKQNKQLNVLSAVLPEDSELSDERFFINRFRDFPNVKINYVTAPDKAPFDDLNDLFARYDSPVLTSRHYLYQAFKDAAADLGSHSILDGSGGELGATFHGDGCYAELFSNFRWRTLRRELILRKKLTGESLRYNFRANVINPLIPDFLVKLKKMDFQNEISPNAVNVLTPEFVADSITNALPELKESRHLKNRVSPDHRINQHRNLLLVQRRAARMVGEFGNRAVEIKFPLMDKRLLEFCLAAPVDLKVRDGYNRYLVRAGLDKILPPAIQWRNSKEAFSPDYLRRYNRQRKQVIEFLAEIKKSDPVREIVDVERIKEWILLPVEDAAKNTHAAKIARDYVPQAVYLIHFLRRFAEFRN
jgi:asparagine synthase (glutamine-hydrolysing)